MYQIKTTNVSNLALIIIALMFSTQVQTVQQQLIDQQALLNMQQQEFNANLAAAKTVLDTLNSSLATLDGVLATALQANKSVTLSLQANVQVASQISANLATPTASAILNGLQIANSTCQSVRSDYTQGFLYLNKTINSFHAISDYSLGSIVSTGYWYSSSETNALMTFSGGSTSYKSVAGSMAISANADNSPGFTIGNLTSGQIVSMLLTFNGASLSNDVAYYNLIVNNQFVSSAVFYAQSTNPTQYMTLSAVLPVQNQTMVVRIDCLASATQYLRFGGSTDDTWQYPNANGLINVQVTLFGTGGN